MRTMYAINQDVAATIQAIDTLRRHLRAVDLTAHLSPLSAARASQSLQRDLDPLQASLSCLLTEHAEVLQKADALSRAILAAVMQSDMEEELRVEDRLVDLLGGASLDLPPTSTVTDAGERYIRALLWADEAPRWEADEAVEAWLVARDRVREEARGMGVAA